MTDPKVDLTTHFRFPCGALKSQPVELKANIEHYRTCDHVSCKARLEAYERVKAAVASGLKGAKPK